MSAAESITVAETLAPTIATQAERARSVMSASREGSKQPSPHESPKLGGREGPPLSDSAISFKLPEDLVSAAVGAPPVPAITEDDGVVV